MAHNKDKKGHGLSYFLDHPHIKRHKSVGNQDPKPMQPVKPVKSSTFLGGTKTSAQSGSLGQGASGATGGTGNLKTNIGKLLTGK